MTKKIIYRAIERREASHKFIEKQHDLERKLETLFAGKIPFSVFHEIKNYKVKKAISLLSTDQRSELRKLMSN